jgi:shikimate dehydrogenase
MDVDGKTKVFCVIGDPIEHTLSPAMHNAAFERMKLNCVYTAFRVARENLREAVEGFKALGMGGVNVTIPHKVDVMRHLDELSDEARIIGAVNTIKIDRGLVGYNTDGTGALRALIRGGADPRGMNVLILGSGGAARSIAVTLALKGRISSLRILGIDKKELITLVEDIKAGTGLDVSWSILNEKTKKKGLDMADILIHCTPVGMAPRSEKSLLKAEDIPPDIRLMDIVYTPIETKLMKEARKAGVKVVISGMEMFVNQGAESERLWLDVEPPLDLMRKVVLDKLGGGS